MKRRDVIIVVICIATALVCIGLTFWGNLKNNGVLTTDAFMGVVAALIGVCSTIIVGFQIASYLELRETKQQVEIIKKERERLEDLSKQLCRARNGLANAFVAIADTSVNKEVRLVSRISTILMDADNLLEMDERSSVIIRNRYKLFYKELQDATHYDIAKLNVFYERYKHIIIPQEIEHYAEISKLHFDILNILNKHIDS